MGCSRCHSDSRAGGVHPRFCAAATTVLSLLLIVPQLPSTSAIGTSRAASRRQLQQHADARHLASGTSHSRRELLFRVSLGAAAFPAHDDPITSSSSGTLKPGTPAASTTDKQQLPRPLQLGNAAVKQPLLPRCYFSAEKGINRCFMNPLFPLTYAPAEEVTDPAARCGVSGGAGVGRVHWGGGSVVAWVRMDWACMRDADTVVTGAIHPPLSAASAIQPTSPTPKTGLNCSSWPAATPAGSTPTRPPAALKRGRQRGRQQQRAPRPISSSAAGWAVRGAAAPRLVRCGGAWAACVCWMRRCSRRQHRAFM